jgi:hypothetical protein
MLREHALLFISVRDYYEKWLKIVIKYPVREFTLLALFLIS